MATLKVIPFTPPAQTVTQVELIEFAVIRQALRAKQAEHFAREQNLIERLKNGAVVEHGVRVARLDSAYDHKVSWKTVAIRLARRLGYDARTYILNVCKNTKGSVVTSLYVGE